MLHKIRRNSSSGFQDNFNPVFGSWASTASGIQEAVNVIQGFTVDHGFSKIHRNLWQAFFVIEKAPPLSFGRHLDVLNFQVPNRLLLSTNDTLTIPDSLCKLHFHIIGVFRHLQNQDRARCESEHVLHRTVIVVLFIGGRHLGSFGNDQIHVMLFCIIDDSF